MSDHAKRAEPVPVLLLLFLSSVLHAEPLAAQDAGSPGTEAKRSFSPDSQQALLVGFTPEFKTTLPPALHSSSRGRQQWRNLAHGHVHLRLAG